MSWSRKWLEGIRFKMPFECLKSRPGQRMDVWCRIQRGLKSEPKEFSLSPREAGMAIT